MTDVDRAAVDMPHFDFSALKFRERDDLEAIFKFWRNDDPKSENCFWQGRHRKGRGRHAVPTRPLLRPCRAFPVAELWDHRLRTYHKTRYDSRANMADWDHSMNLRCNGAGRVGGGPAAPGGGVSPSLPFRGQGQGKHCQFEGVCQVA